MTPLTLIISGLLLSLICTLLEVPRNPPSSPTLLAVARLFVVVGLISFAVGLFYYVR